MNLIDTICFDQSELCNPTKLSGNNAIGAKLRIVPTQPDDNAVNQTVIDRLNTGRSRHPNRPWVAVSMVSSFDGATAVDGRSGGLGNATDRAVLAEMRRQADVILVGAKTVRDEQYGPPKRKELQIAVVSNSLELDWTSPLWTSGRSTVITSGAAPEVPPSVPSIRTGSDRVDVAEAVRQLDANVVVCEGGPSLNAQLFAADLVDEVVLTVAPFAVSGASSRIASGGPELARRYELVSALTDGDWLFLRYVRRG